MIRLSGRFRSALRDLSSGEAAEHRLSVTMRSRNGNSRRAHLFGFAEGAAERPSSARVQWVLVPQEPPSADVAAGSPAVGEDPAAPVENAEDWCASLDLAFRVAGRLHVETTHYTCEGDGSYDSINDL